MGSLRKGDEGNQARYRSRRIYRANGQWFFDTREGPQFGPFQRQGAAERALAVFLAQHAHELPDAHRNGLDAPGAQDGIEHMVREILDVLHCHQDYGPRAARTWIDARLDTLESDKVIPGTLVSDQIGVLKCARDHADLIFDFDLFIEHRA